MNVFKIELSRFHSENIGYRRPRFNSYSPCTTKSLSNPISRLHRQRPRFSFPLHLHIKIQPLATKMATPKSWVSIPQDSDFSLANIPFGIIISKNSQTTKRPAIPIGDHVLDLKAFTEGNGFSGLTSFPPEQLSVFSQPTLNAFAALGQETHSSVREYIQDVFSETTSRPEILKDNPTLQKGALLPKHKTKPQMPMQIGDYTDFYAGYNHAFNAGYELFQPYFQILGLLTRYQCAFPWTRKCLPTKLSPSPSRLPRSCLLHCGLRNIYYPA